MENIIVVFIAWLVTPVLVLLHGTLPPTDAISLYKIEVEYRSWFSYGHLNFDDRFGGLNLILPYDSISYSLWSIATTYTRDAMWIYSTFTNARQWMNHADLGLAKTAGGLYSLNSMHGIIVTGTTLATNSDAIYYMTNHIELVEWLSYGGLVQGDAIGGISCPGGNCWIGYTHWWIVT